MNIPTEICRLMAEREMTQTELARRSGIARPNISAMLSGSRPVTYNHLVPILEALEPSADVVKALFAEVERASK